MSEYYKAAIHVLTMDKHRHDWYLVAIDFAQRHPADFLRSVDKRIEPDWWRECKKIREREGKVAAIKFWRENTGDSLVDSKNGVESL